MKKVIMMTALLSTVAMGATTLDQEFNSLETKFNAYVQKENARYEQEVARAQQAQADLNKAQEMKAQVSAKVEKLESIKDVKFYKAQYQALANEYDGLISDLDAEIAKNQSIISNFEKVRAIKEGN